MGEGNKKSAGISATSITGLVVVIVISFIILIIINYFTLRVMSGVRAYLYGESQYSKGEKDASQNLLTFISSRDIADWNEYKRNISIPKGDWKAREALITGAPDDSIRYGLMQGGNHESDIDNMMWLFNNFKSSSLMREPIQIWARGDSLIDQKEKIAQRIKAAIDGQTIHEQKDALTEELKANMVQLTIEERNFSRTLGDTAREITTYLFVANVVLTLIIIGAVSLYIFKLLKKLNEKNMDLELANKELDRLVYTISHDLRSPISSMMGLVGLAQREKEMSQMNTYLTMMEQTLKKQETFVKETIEMSKENRRDVQKEIVDLSHMLDQVISMHKHMPDAQGIRFSTEIGIYRIFTDKHRLQVILSNLLSNAIKYHDPAKNDRFISVSTKSFMDKVKIEVSDNGIGIETHDQKKVFEMFYMSNDHNKGSGLGLYIVNEMARKIGGEVEIKSTPGEGSTFSVILNK
ncbi:MAG TPA: ATP-binding protein [Cyclobacteriaceae bacterium]|nr:ATP-binding protein [Cyclobacteriaceae bacterium]